MSRHFIPDRNRSIRALGGTRTPNSLICSYFAVPLALAELLVCKNYQNIRSKDAQVNCALQQGRFSGEQSKAANE